MVMVSEVHRLADGNSIRGGPPVQRTPGQVRVTWRVWPQHLNRKRLRAYERDIYLDARYHF